MLMQAQFRESACRPNFVRVRAYAPTQMRAHTHAVCGANTKRARTKDTQIVDKERDLEVHERRRAMLLVRQVCAHHPLSRAVVAGRPLRCIAEPGTAREHQTGAHLPS